MTAALGPVGSSVPGAAGQGALAWGPSWEAALTGLELDVQSSERLLEEIRSKAEAHVPVVPPQPQAPWTPPVGLGPMPVTLVDRAKTLLERQRQVAQELTEAIVLNRRQARAAAAVAQASARRPDGGQAVYVDVSA